MILGSRTVSSWKDVDPENITLTEFYDLLSHHDWTYAYSDDHRYWVSGEFASGVIKKIVELHDQTYADLLENYSKSVWDPDYPKPERP